MRRHASERLDRHVPIRDESDVAMARKWTRQFAADAGLDTSAVDALVTAISEIARNALVHAGGGEIILSSIEDGPRRGVSAVARDQGPGIADVERALQDGYSTAGGLGLGLSSARRLVSEFEVKSSEGGGTTVTLRQWVRSRLSQNTKDSP